LIRPLIGIAHRQMGSTGQQASDLEHGMRIGAM
jgi:hypothetical protein